MRKNVSARKGKQNHEEKNRDSKDAMTKGLQAIAYTAGAVAGLAMLLEDREDVLRERWRIGATDGDRTCEKRRYRVNFTPSFSSFS